MNIVLMHNTYSAEHSTSRGRTVTEDGSTTEPIQPGRMKASNIQFKSAEVVPGVNICSSQ